VLTRNIKKVPKVGTMNNHVVVYVKDRITRGNVAFQLNEQATFTSAVADIFPEVENA
jgi:hypothetical protein